MVRHLLSLSDLTHEEIEKIILLSKEFKKARISGRREDNILKNKNIALIFEKPSTRTRISLQVAITELGGISFSFSKEELQISKGETLKDTAKILSKYVDAIIARVYSHSSLVELSKYSDIPVINALSDLYHPLQAISDLFTIWEKFGKLREINIAFIGDGDNNVAHSLLLGTSIMGLNISIASPKEFLPRKSILKKAEKYARKSGAKIFLTTEPLEAVKYADVIYTDVFVSMGFEHEREKRLNIFLPNYQVNQKLIESAKKNVIFMHCLPAHRGEEVTEEIIDNPKVSIVYDQAENRLYTAKGILAYLLGS